MKKQLARIGLLTFIATGSFALLSEHRVDAHNPCGTGGFDHVCSINCTDYVWNPCMQATGNSEQCHAEWDECMSQCCL
jgi:hypothetical protein